MSETPAPLIKAPMTQTGSNKRLSAYLVVAGCAYFIDKGQTPPHDWGIVLFAVGLLSTLAVTYRAFIDSSDPEAKANDATQPVPAPAEAAQPFPAPAGVIAPPPAV